MGACLPCLRSKSKSTKVRRSNSAWQNFKMVELPSQLREKIWRCLDGRSKKCIRQVCSMFKSEIDLGSGLAVRVDDSSNGNIRFVQSVEVKQACIVRMDKPPPKNLFRTRMNVEYLEMMCAVTPMIFSQLILPLSENLLSLSFLSDSLMNTTLGFSGDVCMVYDASLKNNNQKIYDFPRLIALEIQYGQFPSSTAPNETPPGTLSPGNTSKRRGNQQTLEMFNWNMMTIMRSFNCPRLMCFVVHPDHSVLMAMTVNSNRVPKNHIEWENTSLKNFVYNHRNTLRLLDVFLYSRDIDEDKEHYTEFPTRLTDFIIVIPFVTLAKRLSHRCFWKDIILNCRHLSRLILQVEFWRNYDDFFKILPGILSKNSETLSTIRLESFSVQEEPNEDITTNYRRNSAGFTLNFGLFSVCKQLQVLEIIQLNAKKYFVGVGFVHLPPSLQRLEIKRIFVPSEELYFLRNLPNLKRVLLYHVGASGVFGVDYTALKKLWGNPSLEYLQVCSFNFKNSSDKMKQIIRKSQHQKYKEFDSNVPHSVVMLRENIVKFMK